MNEYLIPQKLLQAVANYITSESIPKKTWAEVHAILFEIERLKPFLPATKDETPVEEKPKA